MPGVPFSQEVFNAREEDVSSDLNRAQNLASRDVQDSIGYASGSLDAADPQHAAGLFTGSGAPISALDRVPQLNAVPATFNMTLGAGQGFILNSTGVTADFSQYKVLRWAQQVVSLGAPAGQPRVDIVVASAATQLGDSASRNILVDPVLRTTTSASVFKTINPVATVSVVAGTPSSTPVPPATPSDSVVLFYVYVPNTATSANNFVPARGMWRRAQYPWSAMGGAISGMNLKWDLAADPAAASAKMTASGFHRVVIDGEVLEFEATFDSTTPSVIQDTGANPFGTSAPSTHDRPYYVYAVGGRHNPYPVLAGAFLSPVVLVESLIAPDVQTGKPSGSLTTARFGGVTDGAAYVGLGFTVTNSTRRRACIMNGDMTDVPSATEQGIIVSLTGGGFNDALTVLSAPSISTRARAGLLLQAAAGGPTIHVTTVVNDRGDGVAAIPSTFLASQIQVATPPSTTFENVGVLTWPEGSTPKFWFNGTAGDAVNLIPLGFNHRVNRFDGCAGA